jgi:hypothetical protein
MNSLRKILLKLLIPRHEMRNIVQSRLLQDRLIKNTAEITDITVLACIEVLQEQNPGTLEKIKRSIDIATKM